MSGDNLLALARALALVAHDNASRKGNGEPYFNHVERVAGRVLGWEAKTVAYLHDTLEDTAVPGAFIFALFPMNIAEAVYLLTRIARETYEEYIDTLIAKGNTLALRVKLADLSDNLSTIDDIPATRREELRLRYTRAQARVMEALA
jgi:(p)ppGpp synthase/HD superfamily hydrolase